MEKIWPIKRMITNYARKGAKVAAEVIRKVSGLLSKAIISGKLEGVESASVSTRSTVITGKTPDAGSASVPKTSSPFVAGGGHREFSRRPEVSSSPIIPTSEPEIEDYIFENFVRRYFPKIYQKRIEDLARRWRISKETALKQYERRSQEEKNRDAEKDWKEAEEGVYAEIFVRLNNIKDKEETQVSDEKLAADVEKFVEEVKAKGEEMENKVLSMVRNKLRKLSLELYNSLQEQVELKKVKKEVGEVKEEVKKVDEKAERALDEAETAQRAIGTLERTTPRNWLNCAKFFFKDKIVKYLQEIKKLSKVESIKKAEESWKSIEEIRQIEGGLNPVKLVEGINNTLKEQGIDISFILSKIATKDTKDTYEAFKKLPKNVITDLGVVERTENGWHVVIIEGVRLDEKNKKVYVKILESNVNGKERNLTEVLLDDFVIKEIGGIILISESSNKEIIERAGIKELSQEEKAKIEEIGGDTEGINSASGGGSMGDGPTGPGGGGGSGFGGGLTGNPGGGGGNGGNGPGSGVGNPGDSGSGSSPLGGGEGSGVPPQRSVNVNSDNKAAQNPVSSAISMEGIKEEDINKGIRSSYDSVGNKEKDNISYFGSSPAQAPLDFVSSPTNKYSPIPSILPLYLPFG